MATGLPAVFLDRDGTLIEDVGHLGDPAMVRLLPDTVAALLRLQARYALFVVSNQSGIAKGLVTTAQVDAVNAALSATLGEAGIHIRAWYSCPHNREDGCDCIKPNPTFLLQAAADFGLDLKQSFIIGDHPHDAATTDVVGGFGLYVLTGHGMRHLKELPADRLVFHCLADAAEWIIRHPGHRRDLEALIDQGAAAIREGGVVAFPTETVYGLGADAFDEAAVRRVFEVKGRPFHDPLIVHVADAEQLTRVVEWVPDKAAALIRAFWPGPLTLVLPKKATVPDVVTADKPTVAVRLSANPWASELIRRAETPVAAPSANLFGRTSPTTAQHVAAQLGDGCDLIIDAGACRVGVESTVLSLVDNDPVLLRAGGLAREAIEAVIGRVRDPETSSASASQSPGMLPHHYAPVTPLEVVADLSRYADDPEVGVMLFHPPPVTFRGPVEVLTSTGDLQEAAIHLFAAIRRLDAMGLRRIVVEKAEDAGLGHAINDRLRKAAAKHG